MKAILIVLLIIVSFVIVSFDGYSQVPQYNLPPKPFYRNAKLSLKDYTAYQCRNITITSDSISFQNTFSEKKEQFALTNLEYVRVQVGNQIWGCCGLGALGMGVMAINYMPESSTNYGSTILISVLSGALIGAAIGSAIPKWKTFYVHY